MSTIHILMFETPTCAACHAIAGEVERTAQAHGMALIHIDAEQNAKAVAHHGVQSLPTLVIVRDGKPAGRIEGTDARPGRVGRVLAEYGGSR